MTDEFRQAESQDRVTQAGRAPEKGWGRLLRRVGQSFGRLPIPILVKGLVCLPGSHPEPFIEQLIFRRADHLPADGALRFFFAWMRDCTWCTRKFAGEKSGLR
jgi:hypothetical protein